MSDGNWLKLHRSLLNWEWYSDPVTKSVFIDILLRAQYAETKYKGHDIKIGQAVIGRKSMAERLGISEQQVRTALNHLKSTNEITIESTNKFSVATVVNWGKWQWISDGGNQQTNQQVDQQLTNNQPTTNQQSTTYKEIKNKRIKEDNDSLNTRGEVKEESEPVDNFAPWNPHQAFIDANRREKNEWGKMSVEERRAIIKKRSDEVLAEIERGIY